MRAGTCGGAAVQWGEQTSSQPEPSTSFTSLKKIEDLRLRPSREETLEIFYEKEKKRKENPDYFRLRPHAASCVPTLH
jgi:hypothetical protein